jgi:putative MATE family efflux protein
MDEQAASSDQFTPFPPATPDPAKAVPLSPSLNITDLRWPTWKIVLLLAWPVLAQQFLIQVVGLSDSFLAGNFRAVTVAEETDAAGHRFMALGQVAGALGSGSGVIGTLTAATSWQRAEQIMARQIALQSAQTTAMYLSWFLSSMMVLVTVGSTALVARSVGARDMKAAIHFTNQSLVLAVALGMVATVLGLIGIDTFIRFLELEGDAARFAVEYLRPMFLLLVFQALEVVGIACLVGAGDTRTGLWVMSGVAIVNLPLAWGLCRGLGPLPELGFVGIAWGTALSHLLGGLVMLGVLVHGRRGLHLQLDLLLPDWSKLWRLLRVSVPAATDSMSVVLGQFWFLKIINQLGDVASSAHGVAIRWEALGFLSGAAFGTAAMTLVGQNLGAQKPERAARSGWVALGIGCLVMSIMGLIFFTLARPMFELFFPHPWQQPSVAAGVPVLQLVAFAMPPLACSIVLTQALRGAGDTAFPVLFTWTGFLLVRIPLAYWLALPRLDLPLLGTVAGCDLGLFGAWLAMFADLMLRGMLFLWRFASGAWMKIKV